MKQAISLGCSVAALVIAVLGSTPLGEAASQLVPRNSVGSLQLKRNAVTARKLSPNAVRTGHVLNGTLLAEDFKVGQLPKGDKGDKGDAGAPGLSGVQIVTAQKNVVNKTSDELSATCPAGKRVIGGGGRTNSIVVVGGFGPLLYLSVPNGTTGWRVGMAAAPAESWTMTAYAVCASVST